MSTIKNQRCFTEATASARLILATGLVVGGQKCKLYLNKSSTNFPNKLSQWQLSSAAISVEACVILVFIPQNS